MNSKKEITVVLATNHELISKGIRTYMKELGIEPLFDEVNTIEDLATKCEETYMILDYQLMEKPRGHFFRNILTCFEGKILVLGGGKMTHEFHRYTILPSDDKKTIKQQLKHFFEDLLHSNEDQNTILSSREVDILKEVALGFSNKEIADRLFISINTVITHRKNITDKLGIKSISGLTIYAVMNNLINPDDVTI